MGDEFGELNGGPLKKGWPNPGAQLEMKKGRGKNTSEILKVPFHPRHCFLLAEFYFKSVNSTCHLPRLPPTSHQNQQEAANTGLKEQSASDLFKKGMHL